MAGIYLCISICLSFQASAGNLTYTGSSTIGQFMQDAAEAYSGSTFTIDTDQVLTALGYSPAQIEGMKNRGVLA